MTNPSTTASTHLNRRQMATFLALGTSGLLGACSSLPADAGSTEAATDVPLNDYPPMPSGPAVEVSAAALQSVQAIGRGINFGNMLEAPTEGAWDLTVEERFIDLVGKPDFVQSVRLPVRWSNHASTSPTDALAQIDPAFMQRVDYVVRRLLDKGVTVVLDMHHYRQLDGDTLDKGETAVPSGVVDLRFLAMWRQIAQHFANFDQRLVFEIYNEPHGRLNTRWNDLMSRALRVIRESNPDRTVVVGPTHWNSAQALSHLVLPPDPNLVLTVHHYEPFAFTHQGAEWTSPSSPTGVSCCSSTQLQTMTNLLDLAVREAMRLNRPVFVGEFGAYEKAALPDRIAYLKAMRAAMEERQLPWMYWELAAGFGVYDRKAGAMRPELKTTLFGR